jgi:ribosome-associated translation inhibitor RaiA
MALLANKETARMQIQVNTDDQIEGREALARRVQAEVEQTLDRFSDQITRVEVHLSDENSAQKGATPTGDKRCLIEARLAGRQPVAASHQAGTIDDALNGAAEKLKRLLESLVGKRKDMSRRPPVRPPTEEG